MFIALVILTMSVFTVFFSIILPSSDFNRWEKITAFWICLLVLASTILTRWGQLHFSEKLVRYDYTSGGTCIRFSRLSCTSIPLGLDECTAVKEEVRCLTPPEWWGE